MMKLIRTSIDVLAVGIQLCSYQVFFTFSSFSLTFISCGKFELHFLVRYFIKLFYLNKSIRY